MSNQKALSICVNEAQLGYLAYLYPDDDPEEALVKLLERERVRALRRAERYVDVLHVEERVQKQEPEAEVNPKEEPQACVIADIENPIGALQERCQQGQVALPAYEFVAEEAGFSCTVVALSLSATAKGSNKKKAKHEAAALLIGLLEQQGKRLTDN
ncbi:MAG TPA: putative dsRNA-binding protein [Stenomitos sp.]